MQLYGKQWPNDFNKRFFIGMHMIDQDQNTGVPGILQGLKPREIVRSLAETGCDTLYFYMSCHLGNCYYPTKVKHGRVHSGIGDVDVFGEVADECVKHEIALVAVYEFMHIHYRTDWEEAPADWKHYKVTVDGKNVVANMCWNTAYGKFVIDQVEEVASQYPVAGFYIDMLDYPGLEMCSGCIEKFKKEMGKEPPTQQTDPDTALYKEYKMWSFREQARFMNEIRQTARKYIPGATVINNFHWIKYQDLFNDCDATDYITSDPGIGYGYLSMNKAVNTPAVFRALSDGKAPFDVLYDAIQFGHLEIAPLDNYLSVTANALANGGYICPDSMWAKDGSLNPAALGLAKEVFKHVDNTSRWVGNADSLKGAGIYLSQETELFYAAKDKIINYTGEYFDEFNGAMMMLNQEHVISDVLTRRQLNRLNDYPMIYLANTVCLSSMEVETFKEYVANGGTLVASHKSSLADEWGTIQENFQLADVFGVDFSGEEISPYIAVQLNVINPDKYGFSPWENPSVTVNDAAVVVKARPEAKVLATLHDRYRPEAGCGINKFYNSFPKEEAVGAGIIEHHYGKGKCIYFAAKIFGAYASKGVPQLRKLAAKWLIASEKATLPVQLKAEGCITMTAFERPAEGRWIIHLVNVQTAPGTLCLAAQKKSLMSIPICDYLVPVHDAEMSLCSDNKQIKSIKSGVSGEEFDFSTDSNGAVTLTVPKIHIHEIIIIEFDQSWEAAPKHPPAQKLEMIYCNSQAIAGQAKKIVTEVADDGYGEAQI